LAIGFWLKANNQRPTAKSHFVKGGIRLAITRKRKEELVAQYAELLSATNGFIVTEYRGLTVAQLKDLRARLREVQGRYVVTKNTLFSRALRAAEWPIPEDLLLGPTAVAFGDGNLPAVAKIVLAFARENEGIFKIKGGVLAGQIIDARQVEAVSTLPSIEELRAQIAGLVVQPAAGLVSVLNAATAQVVQVLQAYVDKNKPAGEAA
jgi:large subunit ribosomal protein L10